MEGWYTANERALRGSSFSPHLCHVSSSCALSGDHGENNSSYNEDTGDELSLQYPIKLLNYVMLTLSTILSFWLS